jgi:tRNA A-37 threonylcarbamoyl transferase component Bud32
MPVTDRCALSCPTLLLMTHSLVVTSDWCCLTRRCQIDARHQQDGANPDELLNEFDVLSAANAAGVRWCPKCLHLEWCDGRPRALLLELVRGFELERALCGTLDDKHVAEKLRGDHGSRMSCHSLAIAQWARQIDEFAADMRRARLKHGDLKPKNMLVVGFLSPTKPGDICVIDFAYGKTSTDEHDNTVRLHTQLEWQCSDHKALVVCTLRDMERFRGWCRRPELAEEFAKHVHRGWQLLPHVYAMLEDDGVRDAFVRNERIDATDLGEDEDSAFDFILAYLISCYLDVPHHVSRLLEQ